MRIEYKESILDKIYKAIYHAERANKKIENIYLNTEEWREFRNRFYDSVLINNINADTYMGVNIKPEVH